MDAARAQEMEADRADRALRVAGRLEVGGLAGMPRAGRVAPLLEVPEGIENVSGRMQIDGAQQEEHRQKAHLDTRRYRALRRACSS
jgi:hypothetical protein